MVKKRQTKGHSYKRSKTADKGWKCEKEVILTNDSSKELNAEYQRDNNKDGKCVTNNKNNRKATYNKIKSRVTHENDNNKMSRIIGWKHQNGSNPTSHSRYSGIGNGAYPKPRKKHREYLPRKRRGGEYVDVEASNTWRIMCPAFDTLNRKNAENNFQKH